MINEPGGLLPFSRAKDEFNIRYYLWANAEFEGEISRSFQTLRQFRGGAGWSIYQYMLSLEKPARSAAARALVKRFHPKGAKLAEDDYGQADSAVLSEIDDYRGSWAIMQREEQLRSEVAKNGSFAKRGRFRKVMKALILERFGAFETNPEESDVSFAVKDSGWTIETIFDFGRRETVLSYVQSIKSERTFPYHGAAWPLVMGATMSFHSHLGICSQTEWHNVLESEVEQTCRAALDLCGTFHLVAPKLLTGLNPAEIIPDDLEFRGF